MNEAWSENETLALLAIAISQTVAIFAAGHAVMRKRDPRSSAGWAALSVLAPFAGPLLYWLFGINRIEEKAKKIYQQHDLAPASKVKSELPKGFSNDFVSLAALTSKLSPYPMREGNEIRILLDGEQAFPRMLDAIEGAKTSVLLSTFIFDNDSAGRQFARALIAAGERGVKVRVLIDDIGARYSFPTITKKLKGKNVSAKLFHRVLLPWFYTYSQLRSHRKLLLVDGELGFLGGMNIRTDHLINQARPSRRTKDTHFEVKGPILEDLWEVFARDWKFSVKENLDVAKQPIRPHGKIYCRTMPNSPRENMGEHRWTLMGALNGARKTVFIQTPYFLPDQELISALGAASLRGVKVQILLPQKNNHILAHWACLANLWQVLETGCEVWFAPGPFDHSKLMVVDQCWSFIGSTNWDARSLRLNFELNIECYDSTFARELTELFESKKLKSSRLTQRALRSLPFHHRFRNALARVLTPYL